MKALDDLYCRLLTVGFIALREAAHASNDEWLKAEIELLHNVPSLVGEANVDGRIWSRYSLRHGSPMSDVVGE